MGFKHRVARFGYVYLSFVLIGVKTKKKVLFAIFNKKKFIFVFC